MAETLEIDFSDDRLISIAAEKLDAHDYKGALKMLNKNAVRSGNDEDSLMLYAEIYDDIGLHSKSVNCWFRYLDCTTNTGEDLAECYEGLAVGFMNLGNEHFSAYYYNKLLMETDELDPEAREEILGEFLSTQDNPLKFVYPPELADYSEAISNGTAFMKEGKFELAEREFDKVAEGNPKYLTARNFSAMCKIIADRTDEAEQECLNILKNHPDDVQALTTLAAVKGEQGKREEAVKLAERLLALCVTDADEIYKIATVCCENKMHERAYETFMKLPPEFDYDLNVLFFKAVSAFNCGRYGESFDNFDTLLTVHPESVTARFWYRFARQCVRNNERQELGYFYRLPQDMREATLKVLTAFMHLSDAGARKLARTTDLTDCIIWCFDECEGVGNELKKIACLAAVRAGMDGIVEDCLLNAFIDDKIKIDMLAAIGERNAPDCFGVVVCNIYRRVTCRRIEVGKVKNKAFVRAYSRLFAHFSVLDDEYGYTFAEAAEQLYLKLLAEDRLGEVKRTDVLAAAIYAYSGVTLDEIAGKDIYAFFGVKESAVQKLLECTELRKDGFFDE